MTTNAIEPTNILPIVSNQMKTKYTTLNSFLKAHFLKKEDQRKSTNTRIPDDKTGSYGGKYYIEESEYSEFLKIYAQEVFKKGKMEHLTECQYEKGPILIDVDLRHDYSITERQYTEDHIVDLIGLYLEVFKKLFQIDDNTTIPIYIFQKSSVNRISEKQITKDGIHIIISLHCEHSIQLIIRKMILQMIGDCWTDLQLTNNWDSVFDEGISTGHTNWQLVGSCKPAHEPYKLSQIYNVTYDDTDGEFAIVKQDITKFDIIKNINKLSARYQEHYEPFLTNEGLEQLKGTIKNKKMSVNTNINTNTLVKDIHILTVTNQEQLDECHKIFIESIPPDKYQLIEANDYTLALPPEYYEQGSYAKWFQVGCALRNIDNSLFITWVKFSAQSSSFNFSEIRNLWEQWSRFDVKKDGLTLRSIMYWIKTDAPDKYKDIRENSIDFYIEQTINSGLAEQAVSDKKPCGATDFDIATVLYHLKKDNFICSSVKGNQWYQYINHRYIEIDSGTTLRMAISTEVRQLYARKAEQITKSISELPEGDGRIPMLQKRVAKVMTIFTRLGCTSDKKNIMTEARELFYDGNFYKLLDTNPYLLCCTNGVWDFREGIFRDGRPDDYISKCTNIDYIPITDKHRKTVDEIYDFMSKLFPIEELRTYMWDHLSSTLVGTAVNQTFNNYIGGGRNGKSVLITLMTKILGEYKGDMPLTAVVTQRRVSIGGLAPEIASLKGVRYAVMQEPKMGDVLNEGLLKEYTSGFDTISARAPYQPDPVKFIPQFKLVVCANVLPEVKAQDHGTWRRIRVVPFLTLFTENPVDNDPHKPYQYSVDSTIDEKFDIWKTVFLALLVDRVIKTQGKVVDCETVLKASNEYRQKQDVISQFIEEKIVQVTNGTLKKSAVNTEFKMWYESNYGGRGPNSKELHSQLDKLYGNSINATWKGISINYDTKTDTPDEDEVDDVF